MNLPNFAQENALKQQRARMGAELRPWAPEVGGWRNIDGILGTDGLDIAPERIEPLPDGTLGFVDGRDVRRIAVYIRDQYVSRESATDPKKLNKVHIADCDTLRHMRRRGRYERYVATNRTDGQFIVNFLGEVGSGETDEGVVCRLFVCINCLKRLNYKNFNACVRAKQKNIKESFNLSDFFERYGSRITNPPPHTDTTAPPNTYTQDWRNVSLRLREQANWECSNCGDDFRDENRKRFLDVHHKFGLKYDNREQNLQVLCIRCHADIDERLKNSPRYAEYIRLKR